MGVAIAGGDACTLDFGEECTLGVVGALGLFAGLVNDSRESRWVIDGDEHTHGKWLAGAGMALADFVLTTGLCSEVAISRGVDENGRFPCLAAALGLGDDGLLASVLHDRLLPLACGAVR